MNTGIRGLTVDDYPLLSDGIATIIKQPTRHDAGISGIERYRDSASAAGGSSRLPSQEHASSEMFGCNPQGACGQTRVPPVVAAQLAGHVSDEGLTAREVEVLRMDKLGAKDRTQAIAIAVRRGIIEL